jgi:hypothetical protein
MRSRFAIGILLIATWCACLARVYAEQGEPKGQGDSKSPIRLPNGVGESEGKFGYFQNKDGGIDAVDLETGKTIWTNAEVGEPLMVLGDRLVVFTHLRDALVVLKRSDGKRLKQLDPLTYAKEVQPAQTGHFTDSWGFAAQVRRAEGNDYLLWKGRRPPGPPSGAFNPKRLKESVEVFRGAFRIDLESGKVHAVDVERLPRELQPLMVTSEQSGLTFHDSGAASREFVALRLNFKVAVRAIYYNNWDTTIAVRAGDALAAIYLGEKVKDDELKLAHWNAKTGKREGPEVVLLADQGDRLAANRPRITLDDRYLFVSDAYEQKPKKDHTMFDIRTGKRVGQFSLEPFEESAVIGQRLFVLVESQPDRPQVQNGPGVHYPRSLRCLNLTTGKTEWERGTRSRYSPPMLLVP